MKVKDQKLSKKLLNFITIKQYFKETLLIEINGVAAFSDVYYTSINQCFSTKHYNVLFLLFRENLQWRML